MATPQGNAPFQNSFEGVPELSFESGNHILPMTRNIMDGQSKSTASEFSSFGAVPAKRYRQTEAANRSRFAEIFAANGMDKLSSDNGFCHQVFPTPLYEEDDEGLSPLLPTKPSLLNGKVAAELEK